MLCLPHRVTSIFKISKDGMIAFSPGIKFTDHAYHQCSELVETSSDIPFIAPYRFDANETQGNVYYRVVSSLRELKDFGRYMETMVVGVNVFRPTWVLIVTWEDVAYGLQVWVYA